jgi:hypothetical protein
MPDFSSPTFGVGRNDRQDTHGDHGTISLQPTAKPIARNFGHRTKFIENPPSIGSDPKHANL